MATPASVPPVPTAQVNPSILPFVWDQISGPVVSICAWRLATLSNWLAQTAPFFSLLANCVGEPARYADVIVGIAIGQGGNLDQPCAHKPERVLFFLALGFGDHDHGFEAKRIGDKSKPDAGIAGGAFHHGAAGTKHPLRHGVLDDGKRGAVLHRLAGIEEFGLAENFATGLLGSALETDQRCIADRSQDIRKNHDGNLGAPGGRFKTGPPAARIRHAGNNGSYGR